MSMGWGNEWLREATNRTMDSGYSTRIPLLVLCLGLLGIGILAGSVILILIWGAASLAAAFAVVRAVRARRAEKRLERRG